MAQRTGEEAVMQQADPITSIYFPSPAAS